MKSHSAVHVDYSRTPSLTKRPAWDEHYSLLDAHDGLTFYDAHLTPLGIQQIEAVSRIWQSQIANAGQSLPEAFYVSPLTRCLQTADVTFSPLFRAPIASVGAATSSITSSTQTPAFRPLVKELIREVLGEHTCDARRSKSYIQSTYPDWPIEPGFTENDELWRADHRETEDELVVRMKVALQDVLGNEGKMIVSITGHSGMLRGCLKVLEHRDFAVGTGGVVPLVVRVQR